MEVGDLVLLNTWYADYEATGIGKVLDVRVWNDSPRNCGCDVTVLWSDCSIQVVGEEDLTYAVDTHESW